MEQWKRHMKWAVLACLIAINLGVMSGCASNGEQPPSPPANAGAEDGNHAGSGTNTAEPPAGTDTDTDTDSDSDEGIDTDPQAPPVPEEQLPVTDTAEPLYRLNGVYRLEPIQEGTPDKMVLLTFDDGPKNAELLGRMLDTLEAHNAKAIFFVNGYRVKQHPELLKLPAEAGHAIGNHSWDHINLKKEDEATIRSQIEDVQQIVADTIGETPRFFRPPFGSSNDAVKAIAADNGLLFMTWSNGSLDWESSTKDKPEQVVANVIDQLHTGANILMHELDWTADALDDLLTELEDRGYGFIDPATIELPAPAQGDEAP